MNIVACIKQVPDTETVIKITADGKDIESQGVKYIVNPYCEFAVEEAVRTKEKHAGSTVTVLSVGPARAKDALRTTLAMGGDRAVHFVDDAFQNGDGHLTAELLAAYLKTQAPDILFVGRQAIDDDCAQVGPMLAGLLGFPFVSVINRLEFSPDQKKAKVQREIEGGAEVFEVELPAVFSCQKGLNEPRYPALKDIMQAKKKEIKELKAADIGKSADELKALSRTRVIKMEYPTKRPPGRVLQGEPADVVKQLLTLLREEAKIL
ncbi:MAG: electron transfer flavoprotein subunit beta/FixA family protein [Candidatus Eremiobacteraeota bacterium]|nr:electron transfer flavoprotein subunit beta/FixA family protein [Candidatus Eremiobacteraeota bacterium]